MGGPPGRGPRGRPGRRRLGPRPRADEGDERVYRLRDVAVMYRTNAQSRALEEAFLRYGLRYQLVGGTRFYQRREVKDALAYLRILRNDHDGAAFERVLNVPGRGIGERSLEVLRGLAAARAGDVWAALLEALAAGEGDIVPRIRGAFAGFVTLVTRLRARVGLLGLPELLDTVLEESGYRQMLMDGPQEGEDRWANLLELRVVMDRYADLAPGDALDRLLEESALVADQDAYAADADAVTLITLHAAKGLEFDVVFISGLEEGVFPHARALDDPRQMEEERRLAYVGLTRARHRLYLTHAAQRATWGRGGFSIPSRFLHEIPADLMHGPRMVTRDEEDEDQRPIEERLAGYDLAAILGLRATDSGSSGGGPRGRSDRGGCPQAAATRPRQGRRHRAPTSAPHATWRRAARPTTAGMPGQAATRLVAVERRSLAMTAAWTRPCRQTMAARHRRERTVLSRRNAASCRRRPSCPVNADIATAPASVITPSAKAWSSARS